MKKLVTQINIMLIVLQYNGAMTRAERLATETIDKARTRLYGLPEVHKDGALLCPIVRHNRIYLGQMDVPMLEVSYLGLLLYDSLLIYGVSGKTQWFTPGGT
ncbi:unnamed protein product [Dibothriocephalus latus]|uniref:Uncharacterized protein n=1 Tax=Dibothriocephalus latus TaxID=60516 RepID=A0A3P7L758_DIBLA|nr:unnamed protein product [Dibothriocephalus latus]